MKVHSLTIVHYGADYLYYTIKQLYDVVDVIHVFYTPTPSHGHRTNVPPIETETQLFNEAYRYDPERKIRWYHMSGITHEGPQRDLALQTIIGAGAEMVVVADCDEIWHTQWLRRAIDYVWQENRARKWRINMIHFWRSFNWACRDDGWPERIIDLRHPSGYGDIDREIAQVYHFGYAVRDEIMKYKWQIHGHKNELRQEWLNDIWTAWPPVDNCHPTNGRDHNGKPFWTPTQFDKRLLPEIMQEHPFYGVERIE